MYNRLTQRLGKLLQSLLARSPFLDSFVFVVFMVVASVGLTVLLFKLFPTKVDMPNATTVFACVFGVIGSVVRHKR